MGKGVRGPLKFIGNLGLITVISTSLHRVSGGSDVVSCSECLYLDTVTFTMYINLGSSMGDLVLLDTSSFGIIG